MTCQNSYYLYLMVCNQKYSMLITSFCFKQQFYSHVIVFKSTNMCEKITIRKSESKVDHCQEQ